MTQAESVRLEPSSPQATPLNSRATSILLSAMSLVLFATVLTMNPDRQSVLLVLMLGVAVVLGAIIARHTRFLLQLRSQQRKSVVELQTSTQDMRHIETQLRANQALARSAAAEAEALRTTTLTLTENWQLDHVLEMLLASLAELIPYESARVLLLEGNSRLFVARENLLDKKSTSETEFPLTFDLAEFPFFKPILKEQQPVILADVGKEREWTKLFPSVFPTTSWLCAPLIAGDRSLGILCAEHSRPGVFTAEHVRLARSLAVSVAAAIQKARLYEQAQIYGAELEKRLSDLGQVQKALEQSEEQRLVSEDKFQTVFRSSPIAFSICTLEEGRFLEANRAFEQRYGYSRAELVESTIFELNLWEDRADRAFMLAQVNHGTPLRNLVTKLRTKSGELKLTAYSASRIRFDGKVCILAVSADIPQMEASEIN